ncbi:MAG: HD domain-containing protein [Chloroflexi bacterium]|nr:HD domain-containing protein [Chloroflexota bacterium]
MELSAKGLCGTSIQQASVLCSELTCNAPKGAVGVDPNSEGFARHCSKVSELLFVYTKKIQTHFPNFKADPLEMLMAGYLHDMGRIVAKDDREQTFHAIVGSKYLEGIGLRRIATITYAHSLCPERLSLEAFDGITYEQALPKYWQQILLTYVDCCVDGNGNFVGLTNRLRELKSRYHSAAMDGIVIKAMPRLKIIKRIVTTMIRGNYAGNFSEWLFL